VHVASRDQFVNSVPVPSIVRPALERTATGRSSRGSHTSPDHRGNPTVSNGRSPGATTVHLIVGPPGDEEDPVAT